MPVPETEPRLLSRPARSPVAILTELSQLEMVTLLTYTGV
jgi:hypothetical protein